MSAELRIIREEIRREVFAEYCEDDMDGDLEECLERAYDECDEGECEEPTTHQQSLDAGIY